MLQNEKESCSTPVHLDMGGEYCTLREISDAAAAAGATKKLTSQKPEQNAQANHTSRDDKDVNLSPRHKVLRSKSTPARETPVNIALDAEGVSAKHVNGVQPSASGHYVIAPARRSTGHVKPGGRRSLGSLSTREPPAPLCYFAYLGKLTPAPKDTQRGRLHSAHDILADRPVIITSTSIISPYATNVICQEFEAIEEDERRGDCHDLLDCCTCMCCVKGLFYHCTKDNKDEGKISEDPCSCQGPVSECMGRWGIMGVMSIFMPCLCCYLPFEAYFKCHDCVKSMNSGDERERRRDPIGCSSSEMEPASISMNSRNGTVI